MTSSNLTTSDVILQLQNRHLMRAVSFQIFYPSTEEPDSGKKRKKQKRTFYGKLKYRYSGKNSEGNRFIKDNDL